MNVPSVGGDEMPSTRWRVGRVLDQSWTQSWIDQSWISLEYRHAEAAGAQRSYFGAPPASVYPRSGAVSPHLVDDFGGRYFSTSTSAKLGTS
jgi:hypothetical protein